MCTSVNSHWAPTYMPPARKLRASPVRKSAGVRGYPRKSTYLQIHIAKSAQVEGSSFKEWMWQHTEQIDGGTSWHCAETYSSNEPRVHWFSATVLNQCDAALWRWWWIDRIPRRWWTIADVRDPTVGWYREICTLFLCQCMSCCFPFTEDNGAPVMGVYVNTFSYKWTYNAILWCMRV